MTTLIFLLLLIIFIVIIVQSGSIQRKLDELRNRLDYVQRQLRTEERASNRQQSAEEQAIPSPRPSDLPETGQFVCRENPATTAEEPASAEVVTPVADEEVPAAEVLPAPKVFPEAPEPDEEPIGVTAEQRPPKVRRKTDYEKYIGENLFGKIGIFVLILGVGFFVKYAIDNDWLGEGMRTALGFACGAALLGVAARLRNKYRSFSSLLAGGAFAVFYVTIAVAYHYYHIFSQGWAFSLLVLTTLLMTAIAIGYDRRELAIVALTGGLVAPFLTASGEGNYVVLFSYLTILHAGMYALSLYKKWWELPVISFTATYLILGIFTLDRFAFGYAGATVSRHMFLFATLFYLLFATAAAAVFRTQNGRFHNLLVGVMTLNNFLYLLFGLTFLYGIELSVNANGLLPLLIAAVNGGLLWYVRRRQEQTGGLRYLLLGLTILFITLIFPIQFQSNTIVVCWAAEFALLAYLYLKTRTPIYEYAAAILGMITLLGAVYLLANPTNDYAPLFFNRGCLTVLCATAAFGFGAWLTGRKQKVFAQAKVLNYPVANIQLIIVASGLLYAALAQDIVRTLSGDLQKESLLLCSVTLLAGGLWLARNRFPIRQYPLLYMCGMSVASLFFLAVPAPYDHWALPILLWCASIAIMVFLLTEVSLRFYRNVPDEQPRWQFTILLNLLATLVWIAVFCHLLRLAGIHGSFSTGLSLALISAGTLQMVLGMRRHQKILRVFALSVFGLVILKLVTIDLWQWPTIGRIVVFILLGVILLVLSFLYQRLKSALFRDDEKA